MTEPTITDGQQSNADEIGSEVVPADMNTRLRWGAYLIVLTGVMFIFHGIGFIYRTYYTSGFELGVNELDGVTAAELATTHPKTASYIAHVHVSFAGLMIAVGLGIIALAWYGIRRAQRWALGTAVSVPLVFAAFTFPIHQTVHFDFDFLLHLGPAALGVPILIAGGILAYRGLQSVDETHNEEANNV